MSRSPPPALPGPRRHPLAPLASPFVWFCVRTRLPPAFFTLLSVPLAGLAFILLSLGRLLIAIPVVFAAAGADAMDGAVARSQGTASRAGGYLDSLTDRLVDVLILLGILIAAGETRSWIAGSLALFGTLTTSAAKWRLHQDLQGPLPLPRDLVGRTDRYVLILAGLVTAGLLWPSRVQDALFWMLVVLAMLSLMSVLVTAVKGWWLLRREDQQSRP